MFGCKNKNFSYTKAKPTKKFGHNGFLRGRLSTDRADLRGFAIDDFCSVKTKKYEFATEEYFLTEYKR